MSNEHGGGEENELQSNWWLDVTIKLATEAIVYNPARTGRTYPVTLIAAWIVLPNGVTRAFDTFSEETPIGEIRRKAGERFKEVWDPINRCER